jgi:very-short-patch-repair endonuclease
MEAATALERLGGVGNRAELVALVGRRRLEVAVRRGEVRRAGRNLYVLASVDEAVVAARRVSGVLSHLSAALAWGWKVKSPPRRPVVTVPRNRHPADRAGIDVRFADLRRDEVHGGRTSRVRTAVDCARTLPFDEALSVVDSALRSGTVTRADLLAAAADGPRTGRARALAVIAVASPRAANPFESVLRAIALRVRGLSVEPQGDVAGIGHADLADARLRIAIEAESFEFHALEEAFRYDVRRYTAMTRAGWLVARFVWEDVMNRPEYVHAVLVDLVALRAGQQAVRGRNARTRAS